MDGSIQLLCSAKHAGVRTVYPGTGYHMLRRQALRGMRGPLVVIAKCLLRHPLRAPASRELANGTSCQP